MTTLQGGLIGTAIGGLMLLIGQLGTWDREADTDQAELYCEMVAQHKRYPSQGWPDYDGTYKTQCLNGHLRPAP